MNDPSFVYRKHLRTALSGGRGSSAEERQRVYEEVLFGIMRLGERNPEFDVEMNQRILSAEFKKLEADPEAYLASDEAASAPVDQPPPPKSTTVAPPVIPPASASLAAAGAPRVEVPAKRSSLLPVMGAALGAAAFLLALSQSFTCGILIKHCHDTGWVKVDNATTRTLRLQHDLGVVPSRADVWFSTTADGARAYAVQYRWTVNESGSPINVYADNAAVFFDIYGGVPVRGTWDGARQNWTLHKEGYLRIVLSR